MKQFALTYFTRACKTKPEQLSVFARITAAGMRKDFSISRQIPRAYWSGTQSKVRGNSPALKELIRYQETLRDIFFQVERDLVEQGIAINPGSLHLAYKNRINGCKDLKQRTTILKAFEEHNRSALVRFEAGQIGRTTYSRYLATETRLELFIREVYGNSEMYLDQINSKFCADFYEWMLKRKECQNNAIMKYIKNIKKAIRFSITNGWIQADPLASFRCRMDHVARPYLSADELNSIEEMEFDLPRMETTRKLFLLSCYTGLSYTDLISLSEKDLSWDKDERVWIRKPRQKTGHTSQIPLIPKAVELIYQLSQDPRSAANGGLLPSFSNQRLNSYLKEIAEMCGISKNLTFHVARHTFATTVTLANGVSLEAVSAFLGHSNIRQTQHYARMVDSRLIKEMDKVI